MEGIFLVGRSIGRAQSVMPLPTSKSKDHGTSEMRKPVPAASPDNPDGIRDASDQIGESMTRRQLYLKPFFQTAGLKLLGPRDFTVVAPPQNTLDQSIIITDEINCVASVLFGYRFDSYIRAFAARYYGILLLSHIFCIVLGIVVVATRGTINPYVSLNPIP